MSAPAAHQRVRNALRACVGCIACRQRLLISKMRQPMARNECAMCVGQSPDVWKESVCDMYRASVYVRKMILEGEDRFGLV